MTYNQLFNNNNNNNNNSNNNKGFCSCQWQRVFFWNLEKQLNIAFKWNPIDQKESNCYSDINLMEWSTTTTTKSQFQPQKIVVFQRCHGDGWPNSNRQPHRSLFLLFLLIFDVVSCRLHRNIHRLVFIVRFDDIDFFFEKIISSYSIMFDWISVLTSITILVYS